MENDKLKELLMQYAENSTSADFTNNVMKGIEAATLASQKESLQKQKLPKAIAILFATICFALIALSFFTKPIELPLNHLPDWLLSSARQIIYFLLIFWTVLFINQWYHKKKIISYNV